MKLLAAAALFLVLMQVLAVSAPTALAQESLRKLDRQGPVTVSVTLLAPPAIGAPIKMRVALDTHSVDLDGVAFESSVALRRPDGSEVAATVEQVTGSGHHRTAVLAFPPSGDAAQIRVVVKNVGGIGERIFAWEIGAGR
jgi:hypothetical protein